MLFVKIAMVAVAIVVMMGVAQSQHWAQRTGLVGRCTATPPPTSRPGGAWYACTQGVLTGFPNLEADSCRRAGVVMQREVWSCTAPVVSLPAY